MQHPRQDTRHDTKVLNSLLHTTIDSVDGYEKAADVADESAVSSIFRQFADERREAVNLLRAEVQRLGGEAEDDGTILASAHRTFLELRTYVQSDKKAAILEVERGEDYIKSKFEDALDEEDLDPAVRDTITDCYDIVLRGHDAAANLKRALDS